MKDRVINRIRYIASQVEDLRGRIQIEDSKPRIRKFTATEYKGNINTEYDWYVKTINRLNKRIHRLEQILKNL